MDMKELGEQMGLAARGQRARPLPHLADWVRPACSPSRREQSEPRAGLSPEVSRPAESSPGLSPPARRSEKGYPATEGSACQNSLRVFRQERVQ